jgi:hypothetical protein
MRTYIHEPVIEVGIDIVHEGEPYKREDIDRYFEKPGSGVFL